MPRRTLALTAACASVPVIIVLIVGLVGSFTSTDGGTITVVRNGGWFDSRDVRQVIQPGSSITPSGWWSSTHDYPATQRNFKVSGDRNADTNEVITVPTKDGVLVGVEGTFYFDLTRDAHTLGEFDDKFGTRTYPTTDGLKAAWDGDDGWNGFLSFTIGNLVQNSLRQEVGNYYCADLIASCSLAQNGAAQSATPGASNDKIQKIQDAVNVGFAREVAASLGGPYFTNVKFVLAKVSLPEKVQSAINDAQAAFAGVTKSQATLQQAQIDAQANGVKQQGYNACPTCAEIDKLKALPNGLTTYAPGAAFAVGGH